MPVSQGLRRHSWLFGCAAANLLLGCDMGPADRPGGDPPPAAFRSASAASPVVWPDETWWRGFKSSELTTLIEAARAHNLDIAAAVARVRQADAQ